MRSCGRLSDSEASEVCVCVCMHLFECVSALVSVCARACVSVYIYQAALCSTVTGTDTMPDSR